MGLNNPEMQRKGAGFVFTYKHQNTTISFDRIRENRGLEAEITISYLEFTIHWARLVLASSSGREGLARTLKNAHEGLVWGEVLAECCHRVALAYRNAEPTIDLASCPSTPLEYLIRPLVLKDSTTLIYGDGATGKSLVAMWLAVILSDPPQRLPSSISLPTREPKNVIYFDWEDQPGEAATRLRRLSKGMGKSRTPTVFYRKMHQPLVDCLAEMQSEIDRVGAELAIVNSIGPACGGDMNDAAIAVQTMKSIDLLPCGRLAVHHITNESAKGKGKARPFGSTYFRNLSRNNWEISVDDEGADEDELILALEQEKANFSAKRRSPIALQVAFEGSDGPITISGGDLSKSHVLSERLSLATRIANLVKESGPLWTGEIASELDVSESVFRKVASRSSQLVEMDSRPGKTGKGTEKRWGLAELHLVQES
ncbi:MAG: AAA family ATPase [Actinomycetota bacterium]